MFSAAKLKRVHKDFFHMHPEKIFWALTNADSRKTVACDLDKVAMAIRRCNVREILAAAPKRFRVTFPNLNCACNRCVCLKLVKIASKTVLHAVHRDSKLPSIWLLPIKTTTAILKITTCSQKKVSHGVPRDNISQVKSPVREL